MNTFGYQEDPENDHGIVRARTTVRIRSWEIPREQRALETLNEEWGKLEFPGLYLLFEGKNKVYVGQAKNVYNRLRIHMLTPEDKIRNWDKALIISNGRSATQSDLNDETVRKALELYLIRLFKANKYNVVAQGEPQKLNAMQMFLYEAYRQELDFFLMKKNVITKALEERGQEQVFSDELRKILERRGKGIQSWGAYEAVVDGEKVFIRAGSKKPKGWQITFRGRKPGSFIDNLQKGQGYLLVSRGSVLLIPLSEVQKVIDQDAYNQDTIDIWVTFLEDRVVLSYKQNSLDVTRFGLS